MLTTEDKKEIRRIVQEENSRLIRAEIMRLLPEVFGRSLVQLKRFFIREIK